MPNHMKFCGSRVCRWALHHTRRGKTQTKCAVRRFRLLARRALAQGRDPDPLIGVGHTD